MCLHWFQPKSILRFVVNSKLLWDGQIWTLINLGDTVVTLLPSAGQPIQLPHDFFVELFDNGSISPIVAEESHEANKEVSGLRSN